MDEKRCITCQDKKPLKAGFYEKPRKFTVNEINIYRLGTHKADDRIRELELALMAMKTTNIALLEIIQDADKRDARRPNISE